MPKAITYKTSRCIDVTMSRCDEKCRNKCIVRCIDLYHDVTRYMYRETMRYINMPNQYSIIYWLCCTDFFLQKNSFSLNRTQLS